MSVSINKILYSVETVLVIIPTIIFLFVCVPWLFAALSIKAYLPSFFALLLWIGGWLGVITLIQMLFELFAEQSKEFKFSWVKSIAGVISAMVPVVMVYSAPPDGGKRAGFLLFLLPIAVGMHWILALRISNKKFEN